LEEYKSTYPLIHNKIISPNYVTPLLRRARLLDWLHERSDARALVIAAEAGYGKTTLLWQWEREVEFPCYWYKLDRNDRDWTLHVSYLVEAVSQRHPGFGRRAHSVLRQMGGPGSSRPGVTAFLLAEMHERLTEPCTFIIDDWQYVAKVTEVRGLWNQILRDAPPTCRFVFASRGKPQLQFARFKTHGGYGELRTDDLRLTEQEIAELFRDVYRDPLTEDEVAELEHRTEGWAASLQLVEVSLRERTTPEERRALIESITATKDSDLFAFLAEEVLEQQSEETRNFLLSTSILQQITPELAERLTGVQDGARRLLQLEHAGLFTYRLDESRYRYHGLFRDFLERRLVEERSDAEVTGLHIHAASYYETTAQWPLAIDHYLRAGLLPQAARLIARYGEDVVSEGRIGLVDEWLQDLPEKAIHDNARLSLLHGEALGIRGDWTRSLAALQRAHEYFARKGDNRMQALALLKQSSVNANWGKPGLAADMAESALGLAPPEAADLRLRIRGNLIITSRWTTLPCSSLQFELINLIAEATQLGLDHYASIGLHNLGQLQFEAGWLSASLKSLERAGQYWDQLPASPFADDLNHVRTLLALGQAGAARARALKAVSATRTWPRANLEALCGLAEVLVAEGRFGEARELLSGAASGSRDLGQATETAQQVYLEASLLADRLDAETQQVLSSLAARARDPRLSLASSTVAAISAEALGRCTKACWRRAWAEYQRWLRRGATYAAQVALLKLGPGLINSQTGSALEDVRDLMRNVNTLAKAPSAKWWLRRYRPVLDLLELDAPAMVNLLHLDPQFWQGPILAEPLLRLNRADRARVLAEFAQRGDRSTIHALEACSAPEAERVRHTLMQRHATRYFVQTFGAIAVHKGSWDGPTVGPLKRRTRSLLAVLAARADDPPARDVLLEMLWPDADPAAGQNSLNQTIFQLRRLFDADYRDGWRPSYVVTSSEGVQFDRDLVRIDWIEIRRRLAGIRSSDATEVRRAADLVLSMVRGEFLGELAYDDWTRPLRVRMHQELRDSLLALANQVAKTDPGLAARACAAVATLDPFDEPAHVALAKSLLALGRRSAARRVITDLDERLRDDIGEGLAEEVRRLVQGS
jgi:ATP/maltotriose-dependent transcriptional regulator MalT/DNA-binding SARP family transcriptional activator